MKKFLSSILCLLLALSMVLCFAACASEKKEEKEEEKASVEKEEEKEEETPEEDDVTTPGGSTAVPVTPNTDAEVNPKVGTYEVYTMVEGDKIYTSDELKAELQIDDLSQFMALELKADGTGKVFFLGESYDITWDETYLINQDGGKQAYEYEDGMIGYEVDGAAVVFIKK